MTFKKRGITVGDLLLSIILIAIIAFISLKYKDKKQQTSIARQFQSSVDFTFQR